MMNSRFLTMVIGVMLAGQSGESLFGQTDTSSLPKPSTRQTPEFDVNPFRRTLPDIEEGDRAVRPIVKKRKKFETDFPAFFDAKPVEAQEGDDEMRRLLVARHNEAVAETRARIQAFQTGRQTFKSLNDACERLLASRFALEKDPPKRIALLEQYVGVMKMAEEYAQLTLQNGSGPTPCAVHAAGRRDKASI